MIARALCAQSDMPRISALGRTPAVIDLGVLGCSVTARLSSLPRYHLDEGTALSHSECQRRPPVDAAERVDEVSVESDRGRTTGREVVTQPPPVAAAAAV